MELSMTGQEKGDLLIEVTAFLNKLVEVFNFNVKKTNSSIYKAIFWTICHVCDNIRR